VGASLPAAKLDDARLARTLGRMLADEDMARRCRELSRRFLPGDALQALCARLEAMVTPADEHRQ
jgi:UDP:flavonoid glycosyltransferase YjiC (YdhE family)